jgi:DNA helicase-2/ATP-dependent DNA helicase PcrA
MAYSKNPAVEHARYREHARRLVASRPRYVVYDVETTGLDLLDEPAPIVWDLGAVEIAPDGGRREAGRIINIGRRIPDAANIAGVDPELPMREGAEEAPTLRRFAAFAAGAVMVGHNIVAFDNPIMTARYAALGLPAPAALTDKRRCIDTLLIGRALFDGADAPARFRLADLAAHLGVRSDGAHLHRAIDDTRLCAGLFEALLARLAARAD